MTNAPAPTENTIAPAQERMLQMLLTNDHRNLGQMVATLREAITADPYTGSRYCAWLLTNPDATSIDDQRQAAAIALLSAPYENYREAGRVGLLGNAVYKRTFPKKVAGLPPYQILRVEQFMRGEYRILLGDLEVERVPVWNLQARYVEPVRPAKLEGETNSAWHRRIRETKARQIAQETPLDRVARSQYQHLKRLMLQFNKARAKNTGHWTFQAKQPRTGLALPTELTVANFRVERVPNFHRPTRLMKGVMRDYLKALEGNDKWFDSVLTLNREGLFDAYRANYIPRSARAQAIMNGLPPEDSTAATIKHIAAETDPTKRAEMVIEADLPYTVASSFLPNSAASWVALIAVMKPRQAANALAWVERSGVLNDLPEVRAAFEEKLRAATGSAAALLGRRSSQAKDEGLKAVVQEAAEVAVTNQRRKVTKRVAVVVDQSGSMETAIEYAAQFAGFLSASVPMDKLLVIAFNSVVRRIEPRAHTLAGWRQAFAELKAEGGTNVQSAVSWLVNHARQHGAPDEIIFITDGGENDGSQAARLLHQTWPSMPVTIFGMGIWNHEAGRQKQNDWHPAFGQSFRTLGQEVNIYLPKSPTDYTLFDQAVAAIGGPSRLQAILDTPLPYRVK